MVNLNGVGNVTIRFNCFENFGFDTKIVIVILIFLFYLLVTLSVGVLRVNSDGIGNVTVDRSVPENNRFHTIISCLFVVISHPHTHVCLGCS